MQSSFLLTTGHRPLVTTSSEAQSRLTRGFGEGLHATGVLTAAAFERDLRHAGGLRALGDRLPDGLGCGDVAAVLQVAADVRLGGRCRDERLAREVVDDLHGNVLVAAEHR